MTLQERPAKLFATEPKRFSSGQFTSPDGSWQQRLCCGVCGSDQVRLLGKPTQEPDTWRFSEARVYFECTERHIFTLSFMCGPSEVWIGSHWASEGIPDELEGRD